MILKLENTTTHQLYEYEVKDMNNGEKLYFRFDIDTSNLVDGEYTLKLYDGEKLVANDLLKIGDFNANTIQYKKGENIYIEVKLDESVQDVKNISISTIETTVLPDDGFNSMGKVDVNAQPLYDNAYHIGHTEGYNEGLESSYKVGYDDGYSVGNEEGYNSGYNVGNEDGYKQGKTDGINTQKSKLETISITNNGTYEREDGYNKIIVDVPDSNGSYDEGYAEGISKGLAQGEINGINIQKEKLESITITENGTYTREDGYNSIEVNIEDTNGSYDEGYADGIEEGTSNAGEIIAETARVLDITENGIYMSRYSEPVMPEIVTGVYPDGTEFYDYVRLNETAYNTQIIPNENTRVEFWYRYYTNNTSYGTYLSLWGTQQQNKGTNGIFKIVMNKGNFRLEYDSYSFHFDLTPGEFHHIIVSKADGLIVDGEQLTTFNTTFKPTIVPIGINCLVDYPDNDNYTDGEFGMIKISSDGIENVFIPTSNGFINQTTGEYLELVKGGHYQFVNNEPIYGEGNLIKTVNVNVTPRINIAKSGIKFAYSILTEIPEWADFEDITDMSRMFYACNNIISIPLIDTSNVINMYYMFRECTKLTSVPKFNTSNVTNMSYMIYGCSNLTSIPPFDTSNVTNMGYMIYGCSNLTSIPPFDTSNVTNMEGMFEGCGKITTIPELDTSKVNNVKRLFYGCSNLTSVPPLNAQNITSNDMFGYGELTKLTDFGGLIGLKVNFNGSYSFNKCPNLTYQSCINILNGLADVTELGSRTLKVHQNFLDLVGDEISIGTNKGWVIST